MRTASPRIKPDAESLLSVRWSSSRDKRRPKEMENFSLTPGYPFSAYVFV